MTDSQFEALAQLLRLRLGGGREAARQVLVDGVAPSAAADAFGVSRQSVSNTLAACRKGLTLAKRAVGISG